MNTGVKAGIKIIAEEMRASSTAMLSVSKDSFERIGGHAMISWASRLESLLQPEQVAAQVERDVILGINMTIAYADAANSDLEAYSAVKQKLIEVRDFIAAAPEMAALISTLHDKLAAAEKDAEGKSIDVNITVDGKTILTTSTPPLRVGDSLSLEIGGYLRGLGIKESNRE